MKLKNILKSTQNNKMLQRQSEEYVKEVARRISAESLNKNVVV